MCTHTAQHSTTQHNIKHVQHSTAQHSTAQHSTAQHSTAQHSTAQHSTAQHSTAQHSTAQHSTAQHSTAQHSTAQHSTACCYEMDEYIIEPIIISRIIHCLRALRIPNLTGVILRHLLPVMHKSGTKNILFSKTVHFLQVQVQVLYCFTAVILNSIFYVPDLCITGSKCLSITPVKFSILRALKQ